jgi:hypothetical protein
MQETRVASWAELQDRLFDDAWRPELGRFRSPYLYRGVPSACYALVTSLARLGGDAERVEGHLLRNFRKYAQRDLVPNDSIWQWLAIAQHYGLPTRLLDWTYSPLVALHFLTSDPARFDEDGVIWCVDYHRSNASLPDQLAQELAAEGSYVFTSDMLDAVTPTLPALGRCEGTPFVVFLEPPSLDERIVNQYAVFSLTSSPTVDLQDWLYARPDLYRRLIVPAALKWEIRDKLDQMNVTERVLFPGPDGLCRWLTRYYGPHRSRPADGGRGCPEQRQ